MFLRKCAVLVLLASSFGFSQAQELEGRWRLRVTNLVHQVMVDTTVSFTAEPAYSCMGGSWKQVFIESKAVTNDAFFPLDGPLAYQVEGGVLTLGRTSVCDGYLFLTAKIGGMLRGSFHAVRLGGGKELGFFSMERIDEEAISAIAHRLAD